MLDRLRARGVAVTPGATDRLRQITEVGLTRAKDEGATPEQYEASLARLVDALASQPQRDPGFEDRAGGVAGINGEETFQPETPAEVDERSLQRLLEPDCPFWPFCWEW